MILHSSGTTSAPKGISHSSNTLRYATEGVCRRWQLTGEDVYLVVCEFGFVGGLVFGYFPPLLNGATGVLVNRWNADEALRLVEEHRCTYFLAMPTHSADLVRAASETTRDLSSMRALAAPGLTRERRIAMREAFKRQPLGDYGLSEVPGHAAHALDEPDEKIFTTEGRPYDGTEIQIVDERGAAASRREGRIGHRQRAEPLPRLLPQRPAHARVLEGRRWLPHRRPRLPRRGRPVRLRRAQQGHHPPRRGDDRPGRGRARDPAPPRGARGRDRAAPRRPARRARLRGHHPQPAATPLPRSRICRASSTRRASRSTRGPSPSRSSTTSRERRR